MRQELELELKTLVTKQQFEQLLTFYDGLVFEEQTNHYYTTNNVNHYAFRIRIKDNEQLFTLKQYIDGKTIEYEKVFDGNFFDDEEIHETLRSFSIYQPYHLFGTLTTKRAIFINEFAELCFDINNYNGITDYEIEYEVHKQHDYLNEFKKILAKANIEYIPSWGSKYKRCLKSLNK